MAKSSVFEQHPLPTFLGFGLVLLVLLFVMAEAGCRIYRHFWHDPNTAYFQDDPELGWVLNTRQKSGQTQNKCGEEVDLRPAPHRLLLRQPAKSDGTRVLFLGDSFTHAHTVSPGKAYYDEFEKLGQGKYSVWAVGVGGYGSVQQYLALRQVYDQVKPDMVIWQLSGNDPHNNVFDLDQSSFTNNSQRLRPPACGCAARAANCNRAYF